MTRLSQEAEAIYGSDVVQGVLFPEARRLFKDYNRHPEAATDWMLDEIASRWSDLADSEAWTRQGGIQDELHEAIWEGLS